MKTFDYTSTFEDYKAAQTLYLEHNRPARLRFRAWMIGLPTTTLLLGVITIYEYLYGPTENFALGCWLTFCAFATTIRVVCLRPWFLKRTYKKMMQTAGLSDERIVRFGYDDEKVVSEIVGRSEGRFNWGTIQDFAQNSTIALLFISKKQFLYIPTRALDETNWSELRATIRQKVEGVHAD